MAMMIVTSTRFESCAGARPGVSPKQSSEGNQKVPIIGSQSAAGNEGNRYREQNKDQI
jgi:hypothetical protein